MTTATLSMKSLANERDCKSYLLWDSVTRAAAIIDPRFDDVPLYLSELDTLTLRLAPLVDEFHDDIPEELVLVKIGGAPLEEFENGEEGHDDHLGRRVLTDEVREGHRPGLRKAAEDTLDMKLEGDRFGGDMLGLQEEYLATVLEIRADHGEAMERDPFQEVRHELQELRFEPGLPGVHP